MSESNFGFDKKIFYIISCISIAVCGILCYFVWRLDCDWYNLAGYIACDIVMIVLTIVSIFVRKQFLSRLAILVDITIIFLGLLYYVALRYDLLKVFFSQELLEEFLARYGNVSAIVFVVVQFLQVTIVPIPSAITTLAGVALFGVWKSFLLSNIGVVAGSMFAFFLGRKLGSKLFVWIGGQDSFERYLHIVKGRDKFMLFIMFLLPFFPDDFLCILAGVTTMTYGGFFLMMMLVRPVTILALSGVFKGLVSIPFSGWGLVVWALVIVGVVGLFVLGWKYGEKIEQYLIKWCDKLKNRLCSKGKKSKIDRAFYTKDKKDR